MRNKSGGNDCEENTKSVTSVITDYNSIPTTRLGKQGLGDRLMRGNREQGEQRI